jgi:hypothetical protein
VFLHLDVNKTGDLRLIEAQNLSRILLCEVTEEMLDHLAREIVKQISLVVVTHVIKIHQTRDNIVFETAFFDTTFSDAEDFQPVGAKMLNPEFL